MALIFGFLLLIFSHDAMGFVLLSGKKEARLDISEENPEIRFQLSLASPEILNTTNLMGDEGTQLSSQDYWFSLVRLAMNIWNKVEDSYVKLDVEFSSEAKLDREDRLFSIVVDDTNYTTAAYAAPELDGKVIADCDIAVSSRPTNAGYLAYTLLHELGHCLGLGHNHSDYSAVMGYSRTNGALKLGMDDEAGLVYLYPNASVGEARELVGCGVIAGRTESSPWLSLFGYLLPAVCILVRLLRRSLGGSTRSFFKKVPLQGLSLPHS